jgi:flavin reductase (DIM6/NTAB) family NADH-FMN oxidoreductase RutF
MPSDPDRRRSVGRTHEVRPQSLDEQVMTIDPRTYRDTLGCFATGVTIITSVSRQGELLGITANSFNSVSLTPPLVLFSLDRRAYSLQAFAEAGCFAINVLRDSQKHLSNTFAKAGVDKWSGVAYEAWDTGCPILAGCLASFECTTKATHDGGDHLIFVGEVQRMVRNDAGSPLLYYRGSYCSLAEAAG